MSDRPWRIGAPTGGRHCGPVHARLVGDSMPTEPPLPGFNLRSHSTRRPPCNRREPVAPCEEREPAEEGEVRERGRPSFLQPSRSLQRSDHERSLALDRGMVRYPQVVAEQHIAVRAFLDESTREEAVE